MQRRTSRRSVFGALLVLTAMTVGLLAWSPAATAEQRPGQSRGQQKHNAQKHNAQQHNAQKHHNEKHNAAKKQAGHKDSAHAKGHQSTRPGTFAAATKSPLDDLLDGLLGDKGVAGKHGPVSKIVNDTIPKAVKKTVDSTTGLVDTALGHGKSTAPAPKPPAPTGTAPVHVPMPNHTPATHPATHHAVATTTAPITRDSAATIRTAPLDSPALVAVKQPAGAKASTPAEFEPPHAAALTPASLLSAPGTGVLVGVMFAFAAGVFAVVYGGGYRGRRTR